MRNDLWNAVRGCRVEDLEAEVAVDIAISRAVDCDYVVDCISPIGARSAEPLPCATRLPGGNSLWCLAFPYERMVISTLTVIRIGCRRDALPRLDMVDVSAELRILKALYG